MRKSMHLDPCRVSAHNCRSLRHVGAPSGSWLDLRTEVVHAEERNLMLTKMLSQMLSAALAVVSVVVAIDMSSQVAWATDKETMLFSFGKGKAHGADPDAGLIFDPAGNIYGTTYSGGRHLCDYDYGCGTIFRLTHTSDGRWTAKTLYSFNYDDGCEPAAALIR